MNNEGTERCQENTNFHCVFQCQTQELRQNIKLNVQKNNGKISHKAHELKVFHELTKQLEKQILLGVIKNNPCITNCWKLERSRGKFSLLVYHSCALP